jgi:hypothetical protein
MPYKSPMLRAGRSVGTAIALVEETFICNSSTIAQFGNQNIVTVVTPLSTDSTHFGQTQLL